MKHTSLLYLFISICLLTSCTKEYDRTTVNSGEIPQPERIIHSSLTGHILHSDRLDLKNATIYIDNETTTTNEYGWFSFENIPMNAEGQLIKITKEGFFDQYKLIYPEVGKEPFISALLLDKTEQGRFLSSEGGVILGSKIKITFEPNSITDNQNQLYNGEVLVFQAAINPDDPDIDFITPGNLRGLDENGDHTILHSFAMSIIKLESPSGMSLNIKEGKSAILTFDIPDTHIDDAPESIPLWYFDEISGFWIEDGIASKVGKEYIGDVTHFSFWNCDISNLAYKLSFRLVTTTGQAIPNSIVRLIGPNNLISNTVFSDANGYVSGLVPGSLELKLLVYGESLNCGTLQSFSLGIINADTDLGDLIITGDSHIVPVKATVIDCNGSPIPNAEILIYTTDASAAENYYEVTADLNGKVFFYANKCSYYNGQYQITHPDTKVKSPIFRYNGILNENDESDLGEIIHCVDTTPKLIAVSSATSFTAMDVKATIIETGINGDKTILIESSDGAASLNIEIELSAVSHQLDMRTNAFNFIASGIFGVNGSCGDCGLDVFGPPIRGVIGEVIDITFPLDYDDPSSSSPLLDVQLNVIISE